MQTKDKIISTLLAAVLILAQLAFVQHAHDLDSHADSEPCQLCLLSAGLDQALLQKHQSFKPVPARGFTDNGHYHQNLQTVIAAFRARAPPADILSV